MGISIYVKGITSEDNPLYLKHLKVWEACEAAGVSIPPETDDYFDGEPPMYKLQVELPIRKFSNDYQDIQELLVKDIPAGVEKIHFIMSC